MTQLVYCILAILILSVFTMTSQRGIAGNLDSQVLTEVETQATGVATEVLELIDQTYFDKWAYDQRSTKPYCGRVWSGTVPRLADPTAFVRCASFGSCTYIEGFHGLATTAAPLVFTRGGFTYNVTNITVQYVNPVTYAPSTTRTYAKRVSVTVENPRLYFGEDASNIFRITFSRVLSYGCATDFNTVPFITSTNACPVDRTPPEVPCARW